MSEGVRRTGPADLKASVRDYWNANPCGTDLTDLNDAERYSRAYFDAIEEERYRLEPEIFSFAQFTRHRGERVLEVGVGAGTDFTQWVRAGAVAHGIDLTPEGVEHVRRRLAVYGLEAEEVRVADCEALPYPDGHFDLVYSWGVIHHTPGTEQALHEIIRVLRPGGTAKVMVYHRHSLFAFLLWVRRALLAGRPWRSLAWCVWDIESPGTKAYTRRELRRMLDGQPVTDVRIATHLTWNERQGLSPSRIRRAIGSALARFAGDRAGWFMTLELTRVGGPPERSAAAGQDPSA